MRLNRFLALAGHGSRRSVEALITRSRVQVNGQTALLQTQVDPEKDKVELDGKTVTLPTLFSYLMLNKPPGYTVTRNDPKADRLVYELVPPDYRHLAYVGRLDKESEGLLIFTNNGLMTQHLLSPASRVRKTYLIYTSTSVSKASELRFVKGIKVADGSFFKSEEATFTPGKAGGGILKIVLTEGKKREIRRMCETLDIVVLRLKRVSIGPVELGSLPVGDARMLTDAEIKRLEKAVSGKKGVSKADTIT